MKQRKYVRKVGLQVPRHITRLMKMRHPTVEILWDQRGKRFVLVQTISGISAMICAVPTPFTLESTVYYLDTIHPSKFQSRYSQDRFLAGVDSNKQRDSTSKESRERIAAGSSDLYNRLTGRKVISLDRLGR